MIHFWSRIYKNKEFSSSEVINKLTQSINFVVIAIFNMFLLSSGFVVVLSIVLVLLFTNVKLTLLVGVPLATAYFILALSTKNTVKLNGRKILYYQEKQIKNLQDAFKSVKDIIINASRKPYVDSYFNTDYNCRNFKQIINLYPVLRNLFLRQ